MVPKSVRLNQRDTSPPISRNMTWVVLMYSKCRRISDVAASPKPKDHFFRPCCVTYSSPTRVESFITEVKRANIRMAATA